MLCTQLSLSCSHMYTHTAHTHGTHTRMHTSALLTSQKRLKLLLMPLLVRRSTSSPQHMCPTPPSSLSTCHLPPSLASTPHLHSIPHHVCPPPPITLPHHTPTHHSIPITSIYPPPITSCTHTSACSHVSSPPPHLLSAGISSEGAT